MDDEDEIVVACTAVVVCLGAAMIATKSKKQKHSTWMKQYIKTGTDMAYSTLLPEVEANDRSRYVQ